MHELGIIVQINKTLQNVAKENNVKKIGSVTLEIGEVSGIIPSYFEECWRFYRKKDPLLYEAELRMETILGITYCEDCQRTYETVKHGRTCPYCQSENTYLVQGNECNFKEIEAE